MPAIELPAFDAIAISIAHTPIRHFAFTLPLMAAIHISISPMAISILLTL
jgi:hypothetical protein